MLKILKIPGYAVAGVLVIVSIIDIFNLDLSSLLIHLVIFLVITAALSDIEQVIQSVIDLFEAMK